MASVSTSFSGQNRPVRCCVCGRMGYDVWGCVCECVRACVCVCVIDKMLQEEINSSLTYKMEEVSWSNDNRNIEGGKVDSWWSRSTP